MTIDETVRPIPTRRNVSAPQARTEEERTEAKGLRTERALSQQNASQHDEHSVLSPQSSVLERPQSSVLSPQLDPWIALSQPFPAKLVEVKPGAVSQEKRRALALAYVDARHYQARLDAVVGVGGWSVSYRPWGDRAVICALTVLGITREDVGEAEQGDPNQATSAAMQAFKRSCAAFGLGRYLYTDLPQIWADAEERGRAWAIKDPAGVVAEMYDTAGIDMSRKQAYLKRLKVLCQALDEEQLIAVGKCAAGK